MTEKSVVKIEHIALEIERLKGLVQLHASEIYVFGSMAGGYAIQGESDLDILVVPSPSHQGGFSDLFKKIQPVIDMLLDKGITVHLVLYDPLRHSGEFLNTVRKKGIRLL